VLDGEHHRTAAVIPPNDPLVRPRVLQPPRQSPDTSDVTRPVPAAVVLIVDDEPEVRELFAQVLLADGIRSVQAPNAEQAWTLLERGLMPAAVLLDLQMPGMGGLGFLLRIRAEPRFASLPVTVVTADSYIAGPTRSAVEALGADVSFKPLDFADILTLARRMIVSPA
jgi:CheY-like chemotaxis protein